jgi:hypothetical protein
MGLAQIETLAVHKEKVKPEQQQQNLCSFTQVPP